MKPSPFFRSLLVTAAIAAATMLAGCETDGLTPDSKAMKPLSPQTLAEIEQKNMSKESPILVRIFKEEAELEVWKEDRSGRFALLKTYPICRWSGALGPKIKEGDRQAPEGFYTITKGQMNPKSAYYLSFNLGYPNAYDKAWGRTGAELMVHGDCSSRGCYAMTDEQISEIYALGRESFFGGQRAFQVQAYPFRMTALNMARHRNNPHMAFWKMLKRGYDHFEVTHLEPKVSVCEKRYVFDAQPPAGSTKPLSFNPTGRCPAYEIEADIKQAVEDKQRQDEIQTAELISRGTPTVPIRTGADGGMNKVFAEALRNGGTKQDLFTATRLPGTIPAHTVAPEERQQQLVAAGQVRETPVTTASADPVPVPRAAPNRAPAASEPPSIASRLGNLFSLASTDKDDPPARPAAAPTPPARANPGAIRPAAARPQPRPAAAETDRPREAAPAPHPSPSSSPWPAANVANAAPAAPGAIRPAPKPQPRAAETQAEPQTATNGTLVTGAAPMVPTGSFNSRWGNLQ